MEILLPLAEQVAVLLKQHRETIAVAESSTGGLISAALLAVPGASAYFLGGAVVYTRLARDALGVRALCSAARAHSAVALCGKLGPGRNRRDGTDRQPLWRSGRAQLRGHRRCGGTSHHA